MSSIASLLTTAPRIATWQDAETVLAIIAACAGGLATTATAARWAWLRAIKVREARRERDARSQAILTRLDTLAEGVGQIAHEVRDNGGSSLKDVVREIRSSLALEVSARRVTETRAIWERRVQHDGTIVPVYVSPEWTHLTGLTREDTENGGWMRAIASADRERIVANAMEAWDDGRMFQAEYDVVNVLTGVRTAVRHRSTPVLDARGRIVGWVGHLQPLW